ncbi:MAG: hypothetical protein R2879_14250 [Saprospiraceae bacterium]
MFSQTPGSNWRLRTIVTDTAWTKLDTLTIIPSSIVFKNISADKDLTADDYILKNQSVKFKTKGDSISVSYRVLPFDLGKPYFKIDTQYINQPLDKILIPYNPFAQEQKLPDFGKLNYNGTFSRGVSFGNSQNLVLNSNLNLQMTGRLTNDIEVLASVSDNSIPLQPEGNTAQLQEFDKVYIQLKRGQSSLTAGDYELGRPDGYFLNYFKKLQGATFSNTTRINENQSIGGKASVAIARGKFARNILQPSEGNQGPYRLQGAEGERFIIVLSGTERVFMDGQQLQRGFQADYVIDYNTASITFTANRLVTKDSRIIVEFDYTDLSYLRSLVALDLNYKVGQSRVYYHLYSDQDSKNSFADGTLSDMDKLALRNAGDAEGGALIPGVDRLDEFNALRVTYKIRDTIICGIQDSILIYSTNPDSAIYTARFTDVGPNNANYILSETQSANGRIYEWVAPVNCIPQGNYAPLIQLAAPRQQQIMTLGAETPVFKGRLTTEVALSKLDQNLFSERDKGDDLGYALRSNFSRQFKLGKEEKGWTIDTDLGYEFVQENFTFISPFRPQEFARDWNLTQTVNGQLGNNDLAAANEQWATAGFDLKQKEQFGLSYDFGGFWRTSNYNGDKHSSLVYFRKDGWNAQAEGSILSSNSDFENTLFYRPGISLRKTFTSGENKERKWILKGNATREFNERRLAGTDTLSQTSFGFDKASLGFERLVSDAFTTGITGSRRWDYLPIDSLDLSLSSIADELSFTGNWKQSKTANLEWNFSYRNLQVFEASQIAAESAETYLGRLNYNFSAWKGTLKSTTGYELGTGQEPKIEYNYLRVNDGEGTYQWNDYNDDGVAQQNEFEIAVFQDSASFVRVSNLTSDFIKTNNAIFNQSILLEPRAIWFTEKGWKKTISRFSIQSISQIIRKVKDEEGISQWNPFELNIADTALVATNVSSRNTIFFNRADPVYDLQFSYNANQNKLVITTGFEDRNLEELVLNGRWNFVKSLSFRNKITRQINGNTAENFTNRNYKFESWQWEPSLNWQAGTKIRTVFSYNWQNNYTFETTESTTSFSQAVAIESNLNLSGKQGGKATALRVKFTYAEVKFDGNANSPVGYAMLDGLRNGQNYLWDFSLDRQLVKNIRLNLSYNGRKTGTGNIVHIGRAQVAAVF